MSRLYTVEFSRDELEWLQLHVKEAQDKTCGLITKLIEPAGKTLSSEQNVELTNLTNHKESCEKFLVHITDVLRDHDVKRLVLQDAKRELEEARELCDEPEAREEARQALLGLPANPSITVTFDRSTLKFALNHIEIDLQKLRASIIPKYEKMKPEEFPDKIRTQSYYVNKARKGKNTLERMKTKLEKGL